ncbi:MAG: putative integral membrane protein [Myxococcota bacterium]|jgi:uncharacterized integral membrane protein
MNRTLLVIAAVIVALVGGVGALFAIQNSSRTTDLSLDLWIVAYQLQEPISVPVLIGASALAGAVLVGFPLLVRSWRLSSRARQLQQQLDVVDVKSEWR